MLLALTHLQGQLSYDIKIGLITKNLCIKQMEYVCFYPDILAKQSRQGSQMENFFFPSLPENLILCPLTTLRAYEVKKKPDCQTAN